MSLFPTIITKEILGRNVAFTSFVGMIATIIAKGRMDIIKCTALTLENECNDLVSVTGGGSGLECDGGLIVLAS
jgi:hypothetical protein